MEPGVQVFALGFDRGHLCSFPALALLAVALAKTDPLLSMGLAIR